MIKNIFITLHIFRGISSVVRRCFHKDTGKPYAVKIIDKLSDTGGVDIEATTREEVLILLSLQGHENISKWLFCLTGILLSAPLSLYFSAALTNIPVWYRLRVLVSPWDIPTQNLLKYRPSPDVLLNQ